MLTHIDKNGKAKMVNVSEKKSTLRKAYGASSIYVGEKILDLIKKNEITKGDVLSTAKIAGIMAAKNTGNIIPLCHPLNLNFVDIIFQLDELDKKVLIFSEAIIDAKTGVEMEALTAVSVAALTIYDMCKGVDKRLLIGETYLVKKTGGKSGIFRNKEKINGYIDKIDTGDDLLLKVGIVGILSEFLELDDKFYVNGKQCKFILKDRDIFILNNNKLNISVGDKVWIE